MDGQDIDISPGYRLTLAENLPVKLTHYKGLADVQPTSICLFGLVDHRASRKAGYPKHLPFFSTSPESI